MVIYWCYVYAWLQCLCSEGALCRYTHCENQGQQQGLEPTVGTIADTGAWAVTFYSCSHSLATGIHMAVETTGSHQVRGVQVYS